LFRLPVETQPEWDDRTSSSRNAETADVVCGSMGLVLSIYRVCGNSPLEDLAACVERGHAVHVGRGGGGGGHRVGHLVGRALGDVAARDGDAEGACGNLADLYTDEKNAFKGALQLLINRYG